MRKLMVVSCLAVFIGGAATAFAADAYGLNLRGTTSLRKFPSNDPSQIGNIVANTSFSSYAMDFNSLATALYCVRNVDPTNLVFDFGTVDTTTGAFTPIANLGTPDASVTGLSVDPTDETFYLSTSTTLYTLNPGTGALTTVGAFGTGGLMIDIAVDKNGVMYGHDIGTDSLYSINKATGVATLIGAHGLAANFAQGMDFDFDTNTLYAPIYTGGGTGKYVSWNLNDGSVNILGDTLQFNVEMELAIASPIPEPAGLLLLGLGALLIRRR